MMRTIIWRLLTVFLIVMLLAPPALAHPGSGIAVDRTGQVYFVDTRLGVWRIGPEGRVQRHDGPAYHWMTIDHEGRFRGVHLPEPLPRDVSIVGTKPVLILGGDFPLVVGADGALYYPKAGRDSVVRILRLTPHGTRFVFAALPAAFEIGPDGRRIRAQWIHGLAAGRDGSLYYTERDAVRQIHPNGSVSRWADSVSVPHCVSPPAMTEARVLPALRGLDVGADGAVYVAASGCSALLKIARAGDVSVVLRATDAWSPTGVALSGSDLFVLEYRYVVGGPQDWPPRVRKVSPDGKVTIVATVERR